MEQTNQSDAFYTFLAWLEHNKKLALGAVALVVMLGAGFGIYKWSKNQALIQANKDLFALPPILGPGRNAAPSAEAYLKVAQKHAQTSVGDQAFLLAAEILFDQGKYAEAQTQFQKFLTENQISPLRTQAAMGVAASCEAQNKWSDAAAKYQEVVQHYSGSSAVTPAKLGLGRVYENQNKPEQALKLYDEIAQSNDPRDLWRSEAMDRREQLVAKNPALARVAEQTAPPLNSPLQISTNLSGKTSSNAPVKTNSKPKL
ncbi:MAG: tetratricopeptide repeat protein [Verrucomicrobiota bacterium]|nr:tetratricopeptide repeat protein [Verrucomicrobiota bacterium]